MNTPHSIVTAVQALASACAAARHRQLVVMAGEQAWCYERAQEVIGALPGEWCWIGDEAPDTSRQLAVGQAHTLLGGESHGLVYDARAGFDPDALGAVTGSLRAGGLLLLLTPPLLEWADYPDPQRASIKVHPYGEDQVGKRYLQRLAMLLLNMDDGYLVEQGKSLPTLPKVPAPYSSPSQDFEECASADQLTAVEALCRVAQGHRRRPLVLVSDRGRGKSAALGLAAARLLQQGIRRIVVTAPRLSAVEQLFQHAAESLPEAELSRGSLKLAGGSELLFEPPDRLLQGTIACDLLLVDEAAAIPASLLEHMLRHHSRIAFATTVHGYEGTGRGFDLRFRKVLDEVTPEWRRLRLEQPIRWAEGDPLEQWLLSALLLDAEPAVDDAVATVPLEEYQFERLDRAALAKDEKLLSQLFGLLVLAHYRTSPGDLRNLLDGPNLEVYVLRHNDSVMATALIAREGGIDEALSQQVYAGERRLRGNLLPQSLATHAGLSKAPELTAARVMRIAVHPARQGQGLGRRLIEEVAQQARSSGMDYLGASFGGDRHLLDFWRACDCFPVRVGLKREASSGAHAMMVMRPLSDAGSGLFVAARQRLVGQFPSLLSEPLAGLEADLALRLLRDINFPMPGSSAWEDVRAFALLNRDYGNSLSGLRECLFYALSQKNHPLTRDQHRLAIAKVLQLRPWGELVQALGLSGRKDAIVRLREIFRELSIDTGSLTG